MTVQELRYKLEQQKGKRIELNSSIRKTRIKLKEDKKSLVYLEEAREVVRLVGLQIQQELQFHISDIATLALESIFPEPYKLVLDFVERRNKTECDILFERDGDQFKPLDASGGGPVDVATFALRIASWAMQQPRSRATIVLDEPLRFLSAEYQENASEMIKEISRKLKIQFLIVTHNPTLASYADKTFEVKIRKGISQVKES